MKRALLLGFIASLVISVSCKKEDSVDTVGVGNPVPKDYNNYYNPGDTTVVDTSSTESNPNQSENPNTVPCIPSELSKNVIAFYPFPSGSFKDYSGYGRNLQDFGLSPTVTNRGMEDCALYFDNSVPGYNTAIGTKAANFLDGLNEFSISLVYNAKDSANMSKFETLVSRGFDQSCPNRSGEWSLALYDNKLAVFGRNNSVWQSFTPPEIILNRWNHVVATFNKNNGNTMRIYLNGTLHNEIVGDAMCSGSAPVVRDYGSLVIGAGFTGMLDDVILFNKELSRTDVANLTHMAPCCAE